MTGEGLPKDDGLSQLWQVRRFGVAAPIYSKPVVFRPFAKVRWNRGKHALESGCTVTPKPQLKLLHYRYLGGAYTAQRNARNFERCRLDTGDKNAAWTCAPNYKGEHSVQWAEGIKDCRWNVIEAPLPV
jgi:hypothetical protein